MSRAANLSSGFTNPVPDWVRDVVVGFAYWLAFLLLLEPGNVARAQEAGREMAWSFEALRIAAAASLGASVTPALMALVRRFPVDGQRLWRTAIVCAAASAATAAVLIVASCLLAAAVLADKTPPLPVAIRDQMAGNWALLAYCIATFIASAHILRFMRRNADQDVRSASPVSRVIVTSRGRRTVLELSAVHWIESQGNYLALHTADGTHWLRETSRRFEASLSPGRFVRIHRRVLVALDQIREIVALEGGDASVILKCGASLRLSRTYRRGVVRSLSA